MNILQTPRTRWGTDPLLWAKVRDRFHRRLNEIEAARVAGEITETEAHWRRRDIDREIILAVYEADKGGQ